MVFPQFFFESFVKNLFTKFLLCVIVVNISKIAYKLFL